MTRRAAFVALLLALGLAAPAPAATLAGVEMPDTLTVDGTALVLNGLGLREATVLRVKAYVGGLYLQERTSDAETVLASRQLKRVTMTFLRSIDGESLASGWAEELRRVSGPAMAEPIVRFRSLIGDVTRGDSMSFTWRPGAGVEVALRGEVRGAIAGDDFARALFSVWFGPHPGDPNLKRGMLGGR
jgi:hypothetical protein